MVLKKRLDGSGKRLESSEKRLDGSEKRPDGSEKRPDGSEKRPNGSEKRPNGSEKCPNGLDDPGVGRSYSSVVIVLTGNFADVKLSPDPWRLAMITNTMELMNKSCRHDKVGAATVIRRLHRSLDEHFKQILTST
ncbi:hypothetical protein RRG08_037553 [Elysia crispata]|uniref:Uncharacterized protein n=1 Tax=Elysia crispata TaxID=231223 RepID=A0AAE1CTD4_9GAST|nr:hypothetical protein RRG08_037553 [Elysia crispata]